MWKIGLGINGFATGRGMHGLSIEYDEVLDHAVELGYDGLELDGRDAAGLAPYPDGHDADGIRSYAERVTSRGLEVLGLQSILTSDEIASPDRDVRAEWTARAVEQVEFCDALGGVQCGFYPAMIQPELAVREIVARMSDTLAPVGERAKQLGVMATFEPEAVQLAYNYEIAAAVVDAVGSPNLKLVYDCGHTQMLDGDALEAVTKYRDQIGHVHFCDNDATNYHGVARHLAAGEGRLDLHAILAALRSVGYDRWIQVDIWGHPDPFLASRLTKAFVDEFLATEHQ